MRTIPTFAGAAILVIGLLMMNLGAYKHTVEVPRTETRIIFNEIRLSPIGDYAVKDVDLRQGYLVNLQGSVALPGSNSSGIINLYVMNNNEYQRWRNGEKNIDYVLSLERIDRFNETFVSAQNGTLYILFDNTIDPKYKKEVTLSAKYSFETMVPESREEKILTQAGYPLAILGVISLVYGLVRKPVVRWE